MINRCFALLRLIVALMIAVPYYCSAQGNDIELNVRYHPRSKYIPPLDSVPRVGSSSQVDYSASSHFTLYQKIDTTTGRVRLLNGAFFGKQTSLSNLGYNQQILRDRLYSISASISYYATMNSRWGYTMFLNSAVNSDFIAVDYNDVFLTGGALFVRQFSPNFRLGFGAIIHNNLGKPMFWPALSVYWNFGGRFNFDIKVPDEGNGIAYTIGVGYKYSEHFKLGFAFKPQTVSYDVELSKGINNRLMNYWELPFELSGNYHKGRLAYSANLGFTALRSFAYAEKELENMFTKYPYYGLATNLKMGVGVKYRF